MKIRSGFVSNSSSSSFIIAAEKGQPYTIKISVDVDLNRYGTYINNIPDYHKRLKEDGWGDVEEYREHYDEKYQKAIAALKGGKVLFFMECATDGSDSLEQMLAMRGLRDVVLGEGQEVIYADRGFGGE